MDNALDKGVILSAVNKINNHKLFNRSPLMRAFLSYVTEETLQGRHARISAYSIAVDALGKPESFDPQMDPSVRVLAKRLRDSLDRYYAEADDYEVSIVLKPGSYVPSFFPATPNAIVKPTGQTGAESWTSMMGDRETTKLTED